MDSFGAPVVLGFILVIIYFCIIKYKEKAKPDLTEAVTIIISTAGLVSSIELGWISIFEAQAFSGKLQDQRIQVLVGAFAVLWVSTQAILQIYSKHFRYGATLLDKL